ncbi:hypothetical protein FKW77_007176 [Venturia effusa]|uniref:Uncharacterized protein n=1 Tax=Venturia effusa TaxID=50376 RepID=A0A517LE51_9PEZI|nr:hypothetical protein FKW77_007176 [Venturia effusa]
MAYHSSYNQYRSRGRRDTEPEEDHWYARHLPGNRDRSVNSEGDREVGSLLRPSYRHLDADVNLRARLQRAPEDPATFRTTLRPYGGLRTEDGRIGRDYGFLPEPRSRLAAEPDVEAYDRTERHRRSSDLLEPGYGNYPEPSRTAAPFLGGGFDLDLTFQREDTWTSSTIDSESSPTHEPISLEKESTDRKATLFNILTSRAWGLGPRSLNGGELHGFMGPSTRKQPCHFRWSHTQQDNMDFDTFYQNAIDIARLNGYERVAAAKSQETIRARFVKPVTAGQTIKGRQMTPNAFFGSLDRDRSARRDQYIVPRTNLLFFSIPFFLLRELAENNLPTRSGLFPTQALLQSQNSAVKKARELSQALRRLYDGDRDICLHVSQVWCLAFGDEYLFTCSILALEDMMGESCKIHIQPRPSHVSPPSVQGRQYITIRSTSEIIVLALDQCKTWLEFISHFGVQIVDFEENCFLKWQGLKVTRNTWADVYQNIINSNSPLHLEARRPGREIVSTSVGVEDGMYNESQLPATGVPGPSPMNEAFGANLYVENSDPKRRDSAPDLGNFHAFTWLCAVPDYSLAPKASSNSEKSASDALVSYVLDADRYRKAKSEIAQFLESRLSLAEAHNYGSATEKSMLDIAEVHEKVVRSVEGEPAGRSKGRSLKAEFAWAVKSPRADDDGQEERLRNRSPGLGDQHEYEITRSPRRHRSRRYSDDEDASFARRTPPPPPRRRSPPPKEAKRPIKMFRAKDVSAFITLAQKLEQLCSKAKIEDDPLQRIHQRTISYFNEEIEAIIRVLEGQGQVIADLTDITSTSDRSFLSPAASMERGRAEFGRAFDLLMDQKSYILQRIDDFTGLAKEALVLESFSRNEIESTKDRHDSAIYAFTIVTIIFLPLSFVCSFLGMNTTDIRDQSTSQWVFWAAGIPLTLVVIVLSLWWSGTDYGVTRMIWFKFNASLLSDFDISNSLKAVNRSLLARRHLLQSGFHKMFIHVFLDLSFEVFLSIFMHRLLSLSFTLSLTLPFLP